MGGRLQPQAIDLEAAVLGAMLLEKEAFDIISEILKPDSFYLENHKIIYRAAQKLAQKNQPIDTQTVIEELKSSNNLEKIGGPFEIVKLTNDVFSTANIETHAKIIFQKFLSREMIRISAEIYNSAYEDSTDPFELLDHAEKSFSDVGVKNISGGMISIDKVVMQAISKIEEWRNMPGNITGVPCCFPELDAATRGWQPGDLIILGARPSTGKTAFALNIVRNAAQNNIKPVTVAVWSLEMKSMYLVLRMLASESKIFLDKIQTGNLTDEEMDHITRTAGNVLSKLNVFFDEKSFVTTASVKRKAKRLKKTHDLGLIVIDYLQLIKGEDHASREQQVAKVSRELKELAMELEIPIIGLSQLTRDTGAKGISWESGPPLSALRESGALEQDADLVMMLWGPSDEEIGKDFSLKKKRKVRIQKHRNGVLVTQELNFKNEIQLFEKIEEIFPSQPGNWKNVKDLPPAPRSYYETETDDDAPF